MSWQAYATDVATCWSRPRSGGLPPSAPLEYMAEKSFWHARNVEDFVGDEAAWVRAVDDAYRALPSSPPSTPSTKAKTPAPPPIPPKEEPVSAPAPVVDLFEDLEGWLKG